MQYLPTIVLTNGTQTTMDMLVGIMPIHQMDTKHNCSLGIDSSASYFKEGQDGLYTHSHSYSYLPVHSMSRLDTNLLKQPYIPMLHPPSDGVHQQTFIPSPLLV
jgi:hypothetical protein